MHRSAFVVFTATLGLGLTGCEVLEELLVPDALSLLGVMPRTDFSQPRATDFGKVVFAIGAQSRDGFSLVPPVSLLEFRDSDGELLAMADEQEIPGADAGSFALLVDGSASMLDTDPERFRVEAAAVVASRIEACSDHWNQALLEFSTSHSDGQMNHSRTLAPMGSASKAIAEAARSLDAEGMTPLFDATREFLDRLDEHAGAHEASLLSAAPDGPGHATYGRALVIISDGADTASRHGLSDVIQLATASGIRIHAIGVGPASDAIDEIWREEEAIETLRRLALDTGGTYGYVSSSADLPTQADAIATAVCGGYTEVVVEYEDPPQAGERVSGFVQLAGTPIGLPYTFTAP
jgi:hypothetical protein